MPSRSRRFCGSSALVTAFLTAIYTFRAVFVAFWGQERDHKLFDHAHESPRSMTLPLIVLAVGAVLAGYIGLPRLSSIEGWLEPVFAIARRTRQCTPAAGNLEWILLAVSALVALGGAFLAYQAYVVDTDAAQAGARSRWAGSSRWSSTSTMSTSSTTP